MAIARVSVEIRAPGTVFGEKLSRPHESAPVGALFRLGIPSLQKGAPPRVVICFCIVYVELRGWMRHRHATHTVPLRLLPFLAAARRAGAFCAPLLSSSPATLRD